MRRKSYLKMMPLVVSGCLFFIFYFCTNRETIQSRIDKFINKHNNETFLNFINKSISYRSSDFSDNIYMVAKSEDKIPPYIVFYNKINKKVTKIDDKLLKQQNIKSYFTSSQIENMMTEFIKFDIQHLSVDSNGNAFIVLYYGENSPVLLRLRERTDEKVVHIVNDFELYKGNWYLEK